MEKIINWFKKRPKRTIIFVLILVIFAYSSIDTRVTRAQKAKEEARIEANAGEVLKGKVAVPETYFKTKEQVEAEFEKAGLKVKFVVKNFDKAAEINKRYLYKDECDQINSDSGATYYYRDEVGGKSGYYADIGETIIVGYSDHDYDGTKQDISDSSESNESSAEKTSEKFKESTYENENTMTKEASKQKEKKSDEYAEINNEIDDLLKENKGWALGTIDENATPIENGTPNPEYAIWIYVKSIIYTGSDVEVQVTADFKNLSIKEKNELASSCQSIAMACIRGDYKIPAIYFYNGEDAYGGSKITDRNSYKWY